jgi:hypothetical protein
MEAYYLVTSGKVPLDVFLERQAYLSRIILLANGDISKFDAFVEAQKGSLTHCLSG